MYISLDITCTGVWLTIITFSFDMHFGYVHSIFCSLVLKLSNAALK